MSGTVQIIVAIFSFLTVVFTGIMSYKMKQLTLAQELALRAAERVAVKVEAVREDLVESTVIYAEKLDAVVSTGNKTLAHVNAVKGNLLLSNATLLRERADRTGDKGHIALAENAERLSSEHSEEQARVDQVD